MSFRIAARTILHLGAELISSDGIALYELIKNAYDARSPNAHVNVVMALSRRAQRDTLNSIAESRAQRESAAGQRQRLSSLRELCLANIKDAAPSAEKLREALQSVNTLEDLEDAVLEANWISVADQGKGMSLATLDEAFLTIGTRSKRRLKDPKQRVEDTDAPDDGLAILGEKGIGRLSAMRLGNRLRVLTAEKTDSRWNELEIDWSLFDHTSDALVEDIHLAVRVNGKKTPSEASGTQILIRALRRDWSREHLEEIARRDFSRLNDPFVSTVRFPIVVKHNDQLVPIPRLESWILKHAHGRCSGQFRRLTDGRLIFSGTMEASGKIDSFSYSEVELLSAASVPSLEVLQALGPFSVDFYWFNRRLLTALEGVGDLATVRARLAQWTGGLMMFRDGFRVPPYGGPDDDWLNLDRKALARGGYKLNRAQIVGRVAITQRNNPHLMDQANREGLIDNEEKRALQELLAHLIQQTFWSFMVRLEKDAETAREPASEAIIGRRLQSEEARLKSNLALLVDRVPALRQQKETLSEIRQGVDNLKAIMDQVRRLAHDYEQGRTQLLNLAGVGLTVEILAHELNRATDTALETLAHLPANELSGATEKSLNGLSAQLRTLQKRLKVLDPLSTSGRNRREKVDIRQLLSDVMESHAEHFAREGITAAFKVFPVASSRLVVTVVRGMIVQILENLISNSLYWLRQQKRLTPEFRPKIELVLDTGDRTISFADNGPGIAEHDKEKVFEAFWTKKPAGDGKGLGLFISREIAKYHSAELCLESDEEDVFRTFVLDLGNVK
jgi:signal transduction histidine kinase